MSWFTGIGSRPVLSDAEFKAQHVELWAHVPDDLKQRIIDHLNSTDWFVEFIPQIESAVKTNPLTWCVPYHFFWGMSVRNLIREVARDDEFPSGNLDDYYVEAVEAALFHFKS